MSKSGKQLDVLKVIKNRFEQAIGKQSFCTIPTSMEKLFTVDSTEIIKEGENLTQLSDKLDKEEERIDKEFQKISYYLNHRENQRQSGQNTNPIMKEIFGQRDHPYYAGQHGDFRHSGQITNPVWMNQALGQIDYSQMNQIELIRRLEDFDKAKDLLKKKKAKCDQDKVIVKQKANSIKEKQEQLSQIALKHFNDIVAEKFNLTDKTDLNSVFVQRMSNSLKDRSQATMHAYQTILKAAKGLFAEIQSDKYKQTLSAISEKLKEGIAYLNKRTQHQVKYEQKKKEGNQGKEDKQGKEGKEANKQKKA